MKYVVKAKKAYLKSPLTATATSVVLRELVDIDDNNITLAMFGDFFVIVVKQGDDVEIIKCNAISTAADGTATLTVASSGRSISPTTPYAGGSTGLAFQSGAEVIVTNDPLSMAQFGNLNIANTWALLQTFTVVPQTAGGNPVVANDLARKAYVDSVVAGIASTVNVIVPGNAGETVAAGNLVYFDDTDNEWKKCDADTATTVENVLLAIAQGAGVDGGAIAGGVMLSGLDANQSGLTAGQIYYASNTAGGISASAGTKEVTIGFAYSATQLYFSPRFDQQLTEDQQDALAGDSGTPSGSNKYVTAAGLLLAVPTGIILPYGGSAAPSGWLLCDGSAVSRTTYATLFAAISTTFGVGDGSTTFNLPDMRGRAPYGVKTANRSVIEDCEDAWNELVDGDVTASLDTVDFKVGSGSAKFVCAAGLGAGDIIATEAISSKDLFGYTTIKLWIKSSVATAAGDLALLLDDTGSCASPLETINIPALVANTWTRVVLTLANPHTDAAIISVGIKMVNDIGAFTLNIDDIVAGNNIEVGDTGGEETHTPRVQEMVAHTHPIGTDSLVTTGGGANKTAAGTDTVTGSTGSGRIFNEMSPFMGVLYIIKT